MKISALITLVFIYTISFAQTQESIWVTQITEKPINESLINDYSILEIKKAFPAAKTNELKNVIEIVCDCDSKALLEELNKDEDNFSLAVEVPEFNTLSVPNDYTLEFANDYALDLINASGAWLWSTGDSTIEIAITDTNFDLTHEELQGQLTYVDPSFGSSNYYHGTAVAITAAGSTDNGLGKSAIGYNSSLQLRGMDYNSVLEATYAGAKVINVSWSSGCTSNPYGQWVINEAYNNGSIVVAAAGNGFTCGNSTALVYPAAYDKVIAVSSVGPQDNHERTIGDPNTTHQHNSSVDICAPGYDVALTVSSGWYLTGNGTSFAAPYVSGTVALMLDVNPCLSFEDVEFILEETAFDLDNLNPNYAGQLGAGRLNAGFAVEMAATYNKPEFVINATPNCDETVNLDVLLDSASFVGSATINWSNGNTNAFNPNMSAGNVYCEVTNEAGCSTIDSINVQPTPSIAIALNGQNVKCHGDATGEISATITGGSGNYNLVWNNGETGTVLADLTAGLYEVLVVDDMGCIEVKEIQIDENPQIEADILVQDYYSNINAGAIDVIVYGGVPAYSMELNGVPANFQTENLSEGIYQVSVIDDVGCTYEETVEIVNQESLSIENENKATFSIFPNPSKGQFTINAPIGSDYQIYNTQGQLILSDVLLSTEVSEVLSAGVYLVQIKTNHGSTIQEKLIIH